MFNFPDIRSCFPSSYENPPFSVYVATDVFDSPRLHCFLTSDGRVSSVGVFIGSALVLDTYSFGGSN
jgi:hypothetical protein